METNEVSLHQVKVYQAVVKATGWITANEIAEQTGVAARTARSHLLKLVHLGILDQAEVFPSYRYQLSKFAEKRNKTYVRRIEKAAEVFGL